jgi:UDP-N-acetylglucosamine:LPS N-acetylglucosamine transferase
LKKILIHLGMGGHTSQILRVVESLGQHNSQGYGFKYSYIIGHDDTTSAKKIKHPGKVYTIKNPRLMEDKSLIKVIFNMLPCSLDACKILLKSKPHALISAGPSSAIPLFWLAKLFGIKTIFIESWVRVHNKSQTGKLVYPVSDLFFVQWITMKKAYQNSIFLGRLS